MGFFVPPRLRSGWWALTPPFHHFQTSRANNPKQVWLCVLCDTFRRAELAYHTPTCFLFIYVACCLLVSGLSSLSLRGQSGHPLPILPEEVG